MSKIPAVIDALVSALQGAPGLSDVEVMDGPVMSDGTAPDWVCVGFDGDPNGSFESATAEAAYNDLYTTRAEQITVPCSVVVSRGDTDVSEARTRAFTIYDAVAAVFATNPGIAGPQTQSAVESTRLNQVQTSEGIEVRLALAVVCNTLG